LRNRFRNRKSHCQTTPNIIRVRARILKLRLSMEIQYNRAVSLGEGGSGSVFSGTFQGRKVAVKRVLLNMANGNEEEALKQLDHPNIVKLFHVECTDDFK
jgi:hypothetical protein